jgi:hypothetical protein
MKLIKMKQIILIFLLGSMIDAYAQSSDKIRNIEEFQVQINADFKNPEESPLSTKDLKNFEGLEFFDIDTSFILTAQFVRTPAEAPFAMPTTTDRKPVYVKYGEVYFQLKTKTIKLNIYQNQELIKKPEYVDYLFLPFTDKTNGKTTYSGGRYLDIRIPEGDSIILNFNKAYNPYCAYNGKYSCPIPPSENNLPVSIPAGVKVYKN